MKKIVIGLLVGLVAMFGIYGEVYADTSGNTAITVNGSVLQTDTQPEIVNGRVFVPLRPIFDALGAHIVWDPLGPSVYAKKGYTEVDIVIGSNEALVSGEIVIMDEPAYISNGRTMVPVRFVAESLDSEVNWDSETRMVSVATDKPDVKFDNDKDFRLLIDGKEPIWAGKAKLHESEYDDGSGKFLIAPLKELVADLTSDMEYKFVEEDLEITVNTNKFVTYQGIRHGLNPYWLQNPIKENCRYQKLIDGEVYNDAEYVSKLLGADYKVDSSKNINITSMKVKSKKMENNRDYFVVNNQDDIAASIKKHFANDTTGLDRLNFYPTYNIKVKNDANFIPVNPAIEELFTKCSHEETSFTCYDMYNMDFWLSSDYINEIGWSTVEFEYIKPYNENEPMYVVANKKVSNVLSEIIKPGMSDREKVYAVYKYVIDNVEYDDEKAAIAMSTDVIHFDDNSKENLDLIAVSNTYGALVKGKAICGGYSNAVGRFLDKLGIKNKYARTEDHIWNLVNVEGKWYHVDATWGDAETADKWFMLTESEMVNVHK